MAVHIVGCDRQSNRYPTHTHPPYRVVKIDSGGALQLCAAGDLNAVGFTHDGTGAAPGLAWPSKTEDAIPRCTHDAVRLEVAAANTIAPGDVVNQANSGMIQSGGTVRVGVALTGGSGGAILWVMPH